MPEVLRQDRLSWCGSAEITVDTARGTAAAEQDAAVQQRHRIRAEDVLQDQICHMSEAQIQQTHRNMQGQPLKPDESPELVRRKERLDAGKVNDVVSGLGRAEP